MNQSARRKNTSRSKKKVKVPKTPVFKGWHSSDEDEIRRRQWRGKTEIDKVVAVHENGQLFGDYLVTSSSGSTYTVEIRSLNEHINSCACNDYRTNRLGTCKHIEGAIDYINNNFSARQRNMPNSRIEVFLDERNTRKVAMTQPENLVLRSLNLVPEVEKILHNVRRGSFHALQSLNDLANSSNDWLRVSPRLEFWVETKVSNRRKKRARRRFLNNLKAGKSTLDILKHPLLPYQIDGVIHLAFGERVLLADDMGLGKTVQAVAACVLLRNLQKIKCVLVISPASLKSEWEAQIKQFTDCPVRVVLGDPEVRRKAYHQRTFFTLCNYEQIWNDGDKIMNILKPDVIILDEAQRIKNWRTKTAETVKKLESRYAFVLTGTPIENRIDEVYSIIQFLDPELLGPLFRFNREYYNLDIKGKPIGYRNLDKLSQRISSVMLRRRKLDVEDNLPNRTEKNFFVTMTDAQTDIYEYYKRQVARLLSFAAKRPLTTEEYLKLQKFLACMRMVCDTPYILRNEPFECPKLDELKQLVPELLEDPDRKIIIFSEWVRMLDLIREYAIEDSLEFSWHTGQVPQNRRRAEIQRFREDPECRLFLSSESGGVGLNLQAADTVINMDLPWNPARLEQRISRAWRKHQTRQVAVVNFISEDTIEHGMLRILDSKKALADGVLDNIGDLDEISIPSRGAFIEKLETVLKHETKIEVVVKKHTPSELDQLRDMLIARHGKKLRHIFTKDETVLVVVETSGNRAAKEEEHISFLTSLKVSVIDFAAHESLCRLATSGFIPNPIADMREIYPAQEASKIASDTRLLQAKSQLERAEHKLKATELLANSGFFEEAFPPAKDTILIATHALATLRGETKPENPESAAEYLLSANLDDYRDKCPLGVARVLSDEDFDKNGINLVSAFIEWVENCIIDTSGR